MTVGLEERTRPSHPACLPDCTIVKQRGRRHRDNLHTQTVCTRRRQRRQRLI
ncbi:betaine-aldehyde dehydrogenase [Mycobacterium intracellulare subsp. chimaera]|nr:betaine-aldehyde dehydrogenase [Mycobacterium intracellulare subsp. chimaera]ASX03121.1 betaine-aldehyde dehydrogenase [Mycobacterium intracellulare subsp. chimaera]PBA63718.1 betaine-aldehyde dehydrogenase [Mycobacterium intracellulare subsp. chimaera]